MHAIPSVFTELKLLRNEGGSVVLETDSGPLAEMLTWINNKSDYGINPTGKALEAEFGGIPYGWDVDVIKLFALSLLRSGQVSAPTVKLHLAALRMLCDYLVTGQVLPFNPAASVRGPKHVVKKGKTPVLTSFEARQLLDSIDCTQIIGLRDRALIGVLVYSFARVSAAIGMNIADYFPQGRRMWFRLKEKGSKHHDVPAHHNAEAYVDAYLEAAGYAIHSCRNLGIERQTPLFRTISRSGQLTSQRMHRTDVLRMIKRRAITAGLPSHITCHTFRATGITCFLIGGGSLEHAQRIAAHESTRTTKLYDRTSDTISLDEIERIII